MKALPKKVNSIFTCPKCNLQVTIRRRTVTDQRTGESRFGGEYYACPNAWANGNGRELCDYSVGLHPSGDMLKLVTSGESAKLRQQT